MASKERMDM